MIPAGSCNPPPAHGSSPRRPAAVLMMEESMARLAYGDDGLQRLEQICEWRGRIDRTALDVSLPLLRDVEVIFTGWSCPRLDETVLAAAPALRAVFHAAGSIRPWVTDAVWNRDLVVVSAHAANAIPVANFTVGAILFSLKRGWHYVGRKLLERCYPLPVVEAPGTYGATVGLVSLGAIGRLVRDRLRAFDLNILVHDPLLTAEAAADLGVTPVALDELFACSDVVSIHTPLLQATEGLITGQHLASMKHGAAFINTARGRIVRQGEMARTLRDRPDLTAVLDVLAEDPPAADDPLLFLPNIIITPHIAGAHGLECRRLGAMILDDFQRWLAGIPPQGRITCESAKHLA